MSLHQPVLLTTRTADQTRRLGFCLGRQLQSGLLIRLEGELGCGKTCFVQGLARGLGVSDDYDITSPSYTLVHEYDGRLPLVHVDLYRLTTIWDTESIGLWDKFNSRSVIVVEWAERIQKECWPQPNLLINMKILDEDVRRIELIGCGRKAANLIKEVAAAFLDQRHQGHPNEQRGERP